MNVVATLEVFAQMASYGRFLVLVGLLALVVSNSVAADEGAATAQTRKLQQLLSPVTNALVGERLHLHLLSSLVWTLGQQQSSGWACKGRICVLSCPFHVPKLRVLDSSCVYFSIAA